MIELTDDMVSRAVDTFLTEPAVTTIREIDARMRKALGEVFAAVERDYEVRPRAPRLPAGCGRSHPHYCVVCSDGDEVGPGCINCRQSGFDQTPWPDCAACKLPSMDLEPER